MLTLNKQLSILRNDLDNLKINLGDVSEDIIEYTLLNINNLDEKIYSLSGSIDTLITNTLSLSGSADTLINNVANLQIYKQNTIIGTTDISLNDLHVFGNITVDGSFNINNIIQNDITINNEILISSQLDILNEGIGPALKVSQLGSGPEKHVVLFNSGEEGDSLLIDSSGNTTIYKDLEVIGDTYMNILNVSGLAIFTGGINTGSTGTISATNGFFTKITVINTTPSDSDELTSKYYVDASLNLKYNIIDAITDLSLKQETIISSTDLSCNSLTITSEPTDASHATTKSYVDASLNLKYNIIDAITDLSLKQETIISSTDLSCNSLTITSEPTDTSHATTKSYVDASLNLKQNILIPGNNISIVGNTISATGFSNKVYVHFISFRSSSFNIFTGTTLPFNATVLNIGSGYSTSTFTFTAPLTGIYFFYGHFFTNANNSYVVDFVRNDEVVHRAQRTSSGTGGNTSIHASFFCNMQSGNTMKMNRVVGSIMIPYNDGYAGGSYAGFGGYLLD